ncbi:hypothetical protein CEXT_256191 [Caerostris extrusa]|uniref:Uncharacterized protein n=1 Tax=Caerostris extrusa TaxID=172846 RepID=A0AAV4ULD6_CAEEX|nr:hypothetical protein CEXT_256191 [Caerostris extrusa]
MKFSFPTTHRTGGMETGPENKQLPTLPETVGTCVKVSRDSIEEFQRRKTLHLSENWTQIGNPPFFIAHLRQRIQSLDLTLTYTINGSSSNLERRTSARSLFSLISRQ